MKDRVPALGKANRVKITQDNGQVVEGVLSYADDAIVQGDALNKANLLPDDVAAYLGLKQSNPQPKDAFLAVADAVGDIKTTVRTDLGEDWLLCNGSLVDRSKYPELFNIIVASEYTKQFGSTIVDVSFGNGVWVALSSESKVVKVYVSSDRFNWVEKQVSTNDYMYSIKYRDSKWVCCGANAGRHGVVLFTATDPLGDWTRISVDESKTVFYGSKFEFANGTWCILAIGMNGYMHTVKVSTNLNGLWSTVKIDESKGVVLNNITFDDNTWVICSEDNNLNRGKIYYTTTPADSWTTKLVSSDTGRITINGAVFYNTKWYVYGTRNKIGTIWVTSSLSTDQTSWVTTELTNTTIIKSADIVENFIYMACTTSNSSVKTVVSFNPTTSEQLKVMSITWSKPSKDPRIVSDGLNWVVCMTNLYYFIEQLPTISVPSAYTYIRAK